MALSADALSTQCLAEFVAAVSAAPDATAATQVAAERAALALEAEVGIVLGHDGQVSSVGFPAGRLPLAEIAEVIDQRKAMLDVPGVGRCHIAVAPLDRSPPGHLVVARSCEDGFSVDELSLVRSMARVLDLILGRMKTFEARERTREELDHIFLLSRDLICTAGFDGYFKHVNPSFERILGYSTAELLERPFIEFVYEEDRERTIAEVQALTEGCEALNFQNRYRCKDGSLHWLEWTALGVPERRLIYATARDVTERKQFEADRERREEALRRSQEQLSSALQRVLQVESERAMWASLEETHRREERRRLASELHDSVSQALFSMNLHIRALQLALKQQRGDQLGRLDRGLTELRDLAQSATSEMRALIFQLRPDALEEDGLVAAIRKHAAAVAARDGLEVRVHASEDPLPLNPRAEVELLRVVQEALHNSVKHAHPDHVEIRLTEAADAVRTLVVEVADDGVGFDQGVSRPGHLGLKTMRERTERLGGQFTVDSSPAGSTTVRLVLPNVLLAQPAADGTNEPATGDVEGSGPPKQPERGSSTPVTDRPAADGPSMRLTTTTPTAG
jgi:PAS domain S-box-containing protein